LQRQRDAAETTERIGAAARVALREEDAVTAGALRADHAVQHHRLALELHDHVDFAVDLQRTDRAARERHEHAFGADVADDRCQLLATEQQPRVEVRVAPDGNAERETLILPELLPGAHERNFADLPPQSRDRRLDPKRAAVARPPRGSLECAGAWVAACVALKRGAEFVRIFVIAVVLLSAGALFASMG
jgi:hypothetical protein